MNLYARQGDLVIEKLSTPLTGDLVKRSTVVFAGDSSGHRHRITGDILIAEGRPAGETAIRVGKAMALVHEKGDGHATGRHDPGDYVVRPLRERGDSSDRAVED